MKKRIILFSLILMLTLLGCIACVKTTHVPLEKEAIEDQMKSSDTMSPNEGEKIGNKVNVNVITKSDNIYTDAQKLETLNELTGEIDKLIDSINNLEDAQDSDLIFD